MYAADRRFLDKQKFPAMEGPCGSPSRGKVEGAGWTACATPERAGARVPLWCGWWAAGGLVVAFARQAGAALALARVAHRFIQRAVGAFGGIGEDTTYYLLSFGEKCNVSSVALVYRFSHLRFQVSDARPRGLRRRCHPPELCQRHAAK